jgi:hypothetical protein
VYRLQHPDLSLNWNQSDSGHFWVTAAQAADPPVVLELRVALRAVSSVNGPQILDAIKGEMLQTSIVGNGYEVLVPPDAPLDIVANHGSDRWVDASLLRFMSGLAPDQLAAQVDAGLWGPSFQYRTGRRWLWQEVVSMLPDHRRNALNLGK